MMGAFTGGSVATALYAQDHSAISLTMVIFGSAAVLLYAVYRVIGPR